MKSTPEVCPDIELAIAVFRAEMDSMKQNYPVTHSDGTEASNNYYLIASNNVVAEALVQIVGDLEYTRHLMHIAWRKLFEFPESIKRIQQ